MKRRQNCLLGTPHLVLSGCDDFLLAASAVLFANVLTVKKRTLGTCPEGSSRGCGSSSLFWAGTDVRLHPSQVQLPSRDGSSGCTAMGHRASCSGDVVLARSVLPGLHCALWCGPPARRDGPHCFTPSRQPQLTRRVTEALSRHWALPFHSRREEKVPLSSQATAEVARQTCPPLVLQKLRV